MEGTRKGRVVSPGTSVQAASCRQREMTRVARAVNVTDIVTYLRINAKSRLLAAGKKEQNEIQGPFPLDYAQGQDDGFERNWSIRFAFWIATKAGFDVSAGFVGGDEDLVGVVLAETGEVDKEAVLVGHGDFDVIDLGDGFESTFGHGVEGMLDGFAFVVSEGAEHGLADDGTRGFEVEGG